jgi:pimeloyl-ACP methyl ester carboxylesterase
MPHIQLSGIRLYYEERGSGAPILLINGTTGFADIWGEAVDELANIGRVIAYDRRGCTRSERPQPYDTTEVADHSADAAALLEALEATPAVLIGRSYGGGVALHLAMTRPELVRALVLLEPGVLGLSDEGTRAIEELTTRVLAEVDIHGPGFAAEALLRDVLGDEVWDSLPAEVQDAFRDNSQAALAELRGKDLQVQPGDLAAVTQPVLVVGGEDSPPGFRQINQAVLGELPNATELVVSGGHLLSPAHPEVLRFVQRVSGGGSQTIVEMEGLDQSRE